jgi:hypothetical protein
MDSTQDFTSFHRYDFQTQVGTVGGNKDFIAMFIFFVLNYFTDIDYLCCIVKSLFLKKQTQTEFLERRTIIPRDDAVNLVNKLQKQIERKRQDLKI